MTLVAVTKKQLIEQRTGCVDNPFYVRWLYPQGGIGYWLFNAKQRVDLATFGQQFIQRFNDDLENKNVDLDVRAKRAQERVVVYEPSLTSDNVKQLSTLLTSPKIEVLTQLNPAKWMTIWIEEGSWIIYERNKLSVLEVSFTLPELNLQGL